MVKDLSLAQQCLLCTLDKHGRLPGFGMEKTLCFVASGILELLMEDILAFEHGKLQVLSSLPQEKAYLHLVYDRVAQKQPVKFEKVVEFFSVSLTDKHLRALLEAVGDSLVRAGCARQEIGGLLSEKKVYFPHAADVDAVVQEIRTEMLEDGALSEDMVALAALLHKSGDLTKYFSAAEKDALKKRLKEIKQHPQSELIRKTTEYIDALLVMIVVAAT